MHRTAIARPRISRPMKWITDKVDLGGRILHYGEGKAYVDTAALHEFGTVAVYEPFPNDNESYKSVCPAGPFDFVISNYVLNVLQPKERQTVIDHMLALGERVIVSVRMDAVRGVPHEDGVITSIGTFQKSYDFEEIDQLGNVLHYGPGYAIVELEK